MPDEEQKRLYEFEALGVPPLKMVLVHAENERANRTRKPLHRRRLHNMDEHKKQELIIRIIEKMENE